jgi:hypothetical protein
MKTMREKLFQLIHKYWLVFALTLPLVLLLFAMLLVSFARMMLAALGV